MEEISQHSTDATLQYVFAPKDEAAWSEYLESHGYCVLRSALDPDTVHAATEAVWRDMTRLYGVDRAVPSTWGSIPTGFAGIVSKGLPQTEGPWIVRGSEAVRQAFRTIWGTDELLVSMDSLLCWLPWQNNPSWEPYSGMRLMRLCSSCMFSTLLVF